MKCKKKSKLKIAQDIAQAAINETNQIIEELGKNSSDLCAELNSIQELFDEIRNIPNDKKIEYEGLKDIRLNWKQQAQKIEDDYKAAAVKNAGAGAAGGGSMAAGNAFLALAGSVGWAIAGVAFIASGLMFWKLKRKNSQRILLIVNAFPGRHKPI